MIIIIVFSSLIALPNQNKIDTRRAKTASSNQYMAIENVELMHECSPEHLRMGTVRLK